MAKPPRSVTIRTYNVGFGDCFLLSFEYGPRSERHVLIDYGSTGLPKGAPATRMMDVALDIKARSGGKLHAVVVTADASTGRATGIERVALTADQLYALDAHGADRLAPSIP